MRVGHGLVRRECLLQPGASLGQQGEIEGHAALLLQQPLEDSRESEDELQPRCTRRARELTLACLKERGEPGRPGAWSRAKGFASAPGNRLLSPH